MSGVALLLSPRRPGGASPPNPLGFEFLLITEPEGPPTLLLRRVKFFSLASLCSCHPDGLVELHPQTPPGSNYSFNGAGGIRTPGTFRYNGFQDRRDQPLCHCSGISCNFLIYFMAKVPFCKQIRTGQYRAVKKGFAARTCMI